MVSGPFDTDPATHKSHPRPAIFLAALVVLAVLSRLPEIHSPFLMLDGDEAVLGLMAKHVVDGRAVPVYFYGQNYGFSLVETLAGAAAFAVGGVGAVPLKYGMLLLFVTGIVGFYLVAARLTGRPWAGFWLALLLLFIPPWTLWSLQARGGYLTAFALMPLICLVGFGSWEHRHPWRLVLLSVLAVGLGLAQPLWIPGLVPLVLWPFLRDRRWPLVLLLLVGSVVGSLVGRSLLAAYTEWILPGGLAHWHPQVVDLEAFPSSLLALPQHVFWHLARKPTVLQEENVLFVIVGAAWCGLLAAATAIQIWRLLARRWHPWSHVLGLSVWTTLAALLFVRFELRYYLPLAGYLVLWIGVEFSAWVNGRKARALGLATGALLLAIVGGMGVVRVHPYLTNADRRPAARVEHVLERLVGRLEAQGVRHVYTLEPMFQWMLMFYVEDRVIGRSLNAKDRYPPYAQSVDRALREGRPTALIGGLHRLPGLKILRPEKIRTFPDLPCFVYLNPDPETLESLGFMLNPPE